MRVSANTPNHPPPRAFLQLSRLVKRFAGQRGGAGLPSTQGAASPWVPAPELTVAGEARELVSTQTRGLSARPRARIDLRDNGTSIK